jgi:diguanylate cyclase (GGDEF)-like protein
MQREAVGVGEARTSELLALTLARGFACLRFPNELESRFMQHDLARRREMIFWGGVASNLAFVGLLIVDYCMVPDQMLLAVILRLGIYVPSVAFGLYMLGHVRTPRWAERLVAVNGMLASVLSVGISVHSHSTQNVHHLVVLSAIVVFGAMIGRFWPTVAMCAVTAALHFGALYIMGQTTSAIGVAISILLGASTVFVLYGVYVLEHRARESFLVDARQAEMDAELARANEALARTVRIDPLTDLANRRHFDEFLSQAWVHAAGRKTEIALVLIDVDHFKAYNDRYGHQAGDVCLQRVAQAIGACLRKSGDLVSRWGGEEFAVVLNNSSPQAALAAAQRIGQAVRTMDLPHAGSATAAMVTVSIGVAVCAPRDALPLSDIIEAADAALYRAKTGGRDRVVMADAAPCQACAPLEAQAVTPTKGIAA